MPLAADLQALFQRECASTPETNLPNTLMRRRLWRDIRFRAGMVQKRAITGNTRCRTDWQSVRVSWGRIANPSCNGCHLPLNHASAPALRVWYTGKRPFECLVANHSANDYRARRCQAAP